jgi:glycosyltransferase involved in cell wall biosynthesis
MRSGGARTKGISRYSSKGLPLISIVMVTFNGDCYLKQAMESVLSQSYANVEVIVVDGGSTDGTLDIIQSFGDDVAYWQSEPDKGIYDAMNKGVGLASGDWVGFKNADDWYCDGAFEVLVNSINSDPTVDVWYGNSCSVVREDPLEVSPFFTDHKTLGRNPGIDHRSCFIRLELHRKILFDTRYRLAADFDVFWRLKKADAVFAHLNSFISYKRYGGASDGILVLKESFAINRKYDGFFNAYLSRFKSWAGFVLWKSGNTVLKMFMSEESYYRFKARKIKK